MPKPPQSPAQAGGQSQQERAQKPPKKVDVTVTVVLNAPILDTLVREIATRLQGIEQQLAAVVQMEAKIMATAQEIFDEIAGESTVLDGVLVLVQRLVSENNPAERQRILDAIKSNRAKAEAALLAGTPQEPPPAP